MLLFGLCAYRGVTLLVLQRHIENYPLIMHDEILQAIDIRFQENSIQTHMIRSA